MNKRNIIRFVATLLIMSCNSMTLCAQNVKFGKPTQYDWDMVGWGEALDAPAVVLCKLLNLEYKVGGEFKSYDSGSSDFDTEHVSSLGSMGLSRENTTMLYDVKLRTKILKENGVGYGNMDIVYYSDENDMNVQEEFYEFSVVVYNQVNGKVKKSNVSSSCYKDERIDPFHVVRHVRVPNLKAGSIIEYQYKLFSNRFEDIYDWQLQERIPVMYSRCEMNIPANIHFNMQAPIHPLIKRSVREGTLNRDQLNNDFQMPKRVRSNVFLIEGSNVIPFSEDLPEVKEGKQTDFAVVHAQLLDKVSNPLKPLPVGKRHIMLNP